ncbi:anti-sigma factor family protein [Streptomyces sp. NPDC057543]|uniref:anti-sigma factor n=1 Tax=Streptomyces sp. NPDC057543 TaxID=3346163 RepID=UPI0036C4031A
MSDDEWEPFGPRSTTGPSSPRSPGGPRNEEPGHDAAGAYLLGVLDDAEASAFEAHLADCDLCGARLDELAGLEPVLATLADAPAAGPGARLVPYVAQPPAPRMLDRLVEEVARGRAGRRRRSRYLVAAAAALIIGGPVVAVLATGGDGTSARAADPHPTGPVDDTPFSRMTDKVRATDPTTKVDATIGMEKKAWGTDTVLELRNVTGPEKCRLIAVSKTGEEEAVTSWSVPKWGYGIEKSPYRAATYPLRVHGGAAMDRGDIDHFEVRTFEGRRLVEIKA